MIIYRKILIIISAQLIPIDMKSRALLVLLILAFSLYLQNIHKPFVTKKLNQFEQQSIFLVIITVYLGFFNYLIAEFKFSVFFIVLFFGYNIWFYIYWIYQFWMSQEKKKKLEHFLMRMVNYSHK